MSQLDILYRAFTDYRRHTAEERDCKRPRGQIARACTDADRLEVIRCECEIEDDWIEEIERGLVHIGKAIAEERQFIRSNGEVVDIEKVKSVSKESVEHLARHSNLFTKQREGEDIIPDRLFTVERLTDYAVYENRFLYMLLCYLRDFIAYRYEKIADLTSTYSGKLILEKTLEADERKLSFAVHLDEERKGDAFLAEHCAAKDKIDRIADLLKTVTMYLSTPLMEIVAKAPMLKPPITETNVLRMNKNFRGAVQTYYFIASYEREGFTVRRRTVSLHPFEAAAADEFAEAAELYSFLTYAHGMKLESVLQKAYEAQLERERLAAEERESRQLAGLKRRLSETGQGAEEYILLLEQRLRALEEDSFQLTAARTRIGELGAELERQKREMDSLMAFAQEQKRLVEESQAVFSAQAERLNEEWKERLRAAEETSREAMQAQKSHLEGLLREEEERHGRTEEELRSLAAEQVSRLNEQLADAAHESECARREMKRLADEGERLERERALNAAQLNALKRQYGLFTETDDFTSREQFDELERQYKAFYAFFKEEWKKTKRKIRREVLHSGSRAEETVREQPGVQPANCDSNAASASPTGRPDEVPGEKNRDVEKL